MHKEDFKILSTDTNTFLISYLHPLTKIRTRVEFKNFNEAYHKQAELISAYIECDPKTYSPQSKIKNLLLFYHQHHPKSELLIKRKLIRDFIFVFGELNLVQLNFTSLTIWLNRVQQENDYSHKSMLNIKNRLNHFFKFLMKHHLIEASPLVGIVFKNTIKPAKPRNYLSHEQIQEIIHIAKLLSPGYAYPLILFFAETACKTSEVIALKWKQINLNQETVEFYSDKNIQGRFVKISSNLCTALKNQKRNNDLVFTNIDRKAFSRKGLSRLLFDFKKHAKLAEIWSFCDLRHSFVKNYLEDHLPIEKLMYLIGHESIHTTKSIYQELIQNQMCPDSFCPGVKSLFF